MAEAACVLHSFTFPSYETKQVGELQESVTFGRFATETLAWDKWSSFSNKRHVEDAAKHSQPGLVAKKKAFFEAYYKKKALLEQENAADGNENCTHELDAENENLNVTYPILESVDSELQAAVSEQELQDGAETLDTDSGIKSEPSEGIHEETSQMELFSCTKENAATLSDINTNQEVPEVNAEKILPACPQPPPVIRASSTRAYSAKGPRVTFVQSTVKINSSTEGLPDTKEGQMLEPLATALIETRTKMLHNSPAFNSRKSRTDQHIFSESTKACTETKSPIISSPFALGTGKGNDKNREKLEEILNSKASKRVQFHTKIKEKAASHLKKLRLGFCFSSKPSPDLHHQSQAHKNQTKIHVACIQQLEKQSLSMKNGCWKNVEKQRSQRQIRPGSLGDAIAHKCKSYTAQIL